jgi:hypothetical protein
METLMTDLMEAVAELSLRPDSPVGAIPGFDNKDADRTRYEITSTGCDNCITICSGGECCF